jgi:GNAT superfamily N-acetyltransferase
MVRIGPARPAEAAALARILVDWARATPWMPDVYAPAETRVLFQRMIATRHVLVARGWRGPLGFIAVDASGHVDGLYLAAAARGRGIGRRLLSRAKRRAGSRGLRLRAFARDHAARAFYARAGFAEVEGPAGSDNDAGLPEVRLEWRGADGGGE